MYFPGFVLFPVFPCQIAEELIHSQFLSIEHISCDLIGHSGPEVYLGGRHSSQARDSSSFPLPLTLMGANKYPSTWARDSSSPVYCSSGAEGSGGGGGGSGKYSPTPVGGSAGLSYQLNPTTLAMLQQHNYIPYFRGIS